EMSRQLQEKDNKIADVEEELAIVKKAVHIFSKPRN
ncbi:transposase, partial [Paenibacillus odorifer]